MQALSLCNNWNHDIQQSKVEEYYKNGLAINTDTILSNNLDENHKEIHKKILQIQQKAISKLSQPKHRSNDKYCIFHKVSSHSTNECSKAQEIANNNNLGDNSRANRFKSSSNSKIDKLCDFHKTNTHSNEECGAQQNNKKSGSRGHNDKPVQTLITQHESIKETIIPEITIKIEDIILHATIDTGAPCTLVRQKEVDRLKSKDIVTQEWNGITANNQDTRSSKSINLQFSVENNNKTLYKTKAITVNYLSSDMIIGSADPKRFNTILDFSENVMIIDGKTFDLPNKNMDDIFQKTKIGSIKTKLNALIDTAKRNNPPLRSITEVKHTIELLNDKPVKCKPYPVPFAIRDRVEEELNRLLKLQVIRLGKSKYMSSAFAIPKKNENIRIVNDYRALNEVSIKDPYPIPSIIDLMHNIKNSTILSQLDLNNGYYQILIDEKDINKTAFFLNNQQYEYLRMPFGLTGAPSTFQRCMRTIFQDLEFVQTFLDDILVYSNNEEDLIEHLTRIFTRCSEYNISINFSKSTFMKKEIKYLGLVIKDGEYFPQIDESALSALDTYPKTIRQLQKRLGKINWFRPFIKDLSITISPLYYQQKDKNFVFTQNHYKIIQTVKEAISNSAGSQSQTLIKISNFAQTPATRGVVRF